MCGIFGYANYGVSVTSYTVLEHLLTGLRRLEYRGYDSAGLAIDVSGPEDVAVIKSSGTVSSLAASVVALQKPGERLSENPSFRHHVGIAHTRWATHGAPSEVNSHPHVSDPTCQFVVVHNGIITNYKPLKKMLTAKGFQFESDTDTEVIAKFLKFLYETVRENDRPLSFPRLVMHLMHGLEGAYALLLRSTVYPHEIMACKQGSPLVLGLRPAKGGEIAVMRSSLSVNDLQLASIAGKKPEPAEYFFSSDPSALVEHTDRVVYFEDNDLVHISKEGALDMFNYWDKEARALSLHRTINKLDLELEQLMKGVYPHFMLKEIYEQPETVTQTMRGRIVPNIRGGSGVLLGGLLQRAADIRRSHRIIFVGCGTSFNACLAARQVMEELTELPVSVELASDFLDRQTPLFRSDVCVFVSQSGETADTLQALRYAKKCQALTVGIVNVVGSSIARMTDCGVHLNAGAEIGVASTKVYTSQIVVLVTVALQLSVDSVAKQDRRREIHCALVELPSKIEDTLKRTNEKMKALAERFRDNSSILLFGRGFHYATCLEGALKIKEVSYIHTEGIHAGELKHGPLALVDENMPVILFTNNDSCAPKTLNALHQVAARGGHQNLMIVGADGNAETHCLAKSAELILVPDTVDCLQCVLSIIPMQLLSYHLAVSRDLNVDQPRYALLPLSISFLFLPWISDFCFCVAGPWPRVSPLNRRGGKPSAVLANLQDDRLHFR